MVASFWIDVCVGKHRSFPCVDNWWRLRRQICIGGSTIIYIFGSSILCSITICVVHFTALCWFSLWFLVLRWFGVSSFFATNCQSLQELFPVDSVHVAKSPQSLVKLEDFPELFLGQICWSVISAILLVLVILLVQLRFLLYFAARSSSSLRWWLLLHWFGRLCCMHLKLLTNSLVLAILTQFWRWFKFVYHFRNCSTCRFDQG